MQKVERFLAKIIDFVGWITAFIMIAMILNVAYDVFMRYLFHNSSIAMQELEWHLFATMMLFGVGYALKEEAHVRVDFLYDRLNPKKKAVINIVGTLLFLIPLSLLIIYGSYDFVLDSYDTNEISDDPGGLTHRWIIKAMIPLSFAFLILCAIYYIIKNIEVYRGKESLDQVNEDML
jgi:TRAP-type mannitol/chloroaromatic compound transport system permease small subunit